MGLSKKQRELLELRDSFCIRMSSVENPINTTEMVEMIRRQCVDKMDIAIRIDGMFTAKGGYVYKPYRDRFPWVIEPFKIPYDRGIIINAIDPHSATPHGVVWVWVDYEGEVETEPLNPKVEKKFITPKLRGGKPNIFSVAELFYEGNIEQLSNAIKEKEQELFGRGPYVRLCDQSSWNTDQRYLTMKTTAELFAENDIYVIKGSKDMTGGNEKVNIELQERSDGFPRLMIFSDMSRLRFEMVNYHYPSLRGRTADERKRPDKPIDKDDHIIECQRRAIEYIIDLDIDICEIEDMVPELINTGIDVNFEIEDDDIDFLGF